MSANRSRKSRLIQAAVRGMLTGVVLSGMFLAGFLLRGQVPVAADADGESGDFPLLVEVKDLLETNYLRPLPEDRATVHLLHRPASRAERIGCAGR